MSGGTWAYDQLRLDSLADRLQEGTRPYDDVELGLPAGERLRQDINNHFLETS